MCAVLFQFLVFIDSVGGDYQRLAGVDSPFDFALDSHLFLPRNLNDNIENKYVNTHKSLYYYVNMYKWINN